MSLIQPLLQPKSAFALRSAIPCSLSGDDYDFEQDRAVIETRALIRDWHLAANGRIRADVGIHAEYTSRPEHWRKVSELAEKHNL